MRHRAVTVSLTLVLVAASACRGILGFTPLTLGDADGGDDAGEKSVPDARSGGHVDAKGGDASTHVDATAKPDVIARPDVTSSGDVVTQPDVRAKPDVATTADASCPSATPTVLFTTTEPIGQFTGSGTPLFLSPTHVYAELFNPFIGENDASYEPFAGLIGCKKTGCTGVADTVVNPASIPDGSIWGSATANEAGLYSARDLNVEGPTPGEIRSANLDGGAAQILAKGLAYPLYIAATDDALYWTNDSFTVANIASPEVPWSVMVGRLGTEPFVGSVLFSAPSSSYPATFSIFVDSANVYAIAGDTVAGANDIGLWVCPRSASDGGGGCPSGPVEILAGLDPTGMGTPDSCAADGENVYQAAQLSGEIVRTNLATHVQTTLASGQSMPANLVVAGGELYFSTASGEILHMPTGQPSTPLPFVCNLSGVSAMATDGQRLYFVAHGAGGTEVASVALP